MAMWHGIRDALLYNWGLPAFVEYDACNHCYLFKIQGFAFYSRIERFPDTPRAGRDAFMEYLWSLEIEA